MEEIKTVEEMHEMTVRDLKEYSHEIWTHMRQVDAIVNYMEKVGQPKLLPEPVTVEFVEDLESDDE